MQTTLRYIAMVLLLFGCANRAIDVGSDQGGVMEDAGFIEWPTAAACSSGAQLPIVGTWEGYVEEGWRLNLPSRSDKVKLVISSANASRVCGTITLGTGTPPPVPTDPDNPEIPGIDGGADRAGEDARLVDGYPLILLNGRASLPRLQFDTNMGQFWRPWCAMQTPYQRTDSPDWYCVPLDARGSSGSGATNCFLGDFNNNVPVNCAKLALCTTAHVCMCTATGCKVPGGNPDASQVGASQYDLRVTGDEINGRGPTSEIHLTRVR